MSKIIENKYSKEWKEYLIQMLKLYAKTLEENAEEIIGDYSFTGDLSIMFTLPTDQRSPALPSISVSKDYFPNYRAFGEIHEKFENEKYKAIEQEEIKKMKQEIITCDICGRDINIPNEEEHTATAESLNREITILSNWPSFLHLSIVGHGELYSNIQTEIDVCWQCIADKFVIKNRSQTEKGVGRICFTTGAQTNLGMAEIYPK